MAFRSEKAAGAFVGLALLLSPAAAIAAELRFEVRHDHLHKGGKGTLTVTEQGLSFTEPKKKGHARNWQWEDIQQLELTPGAMRVLTYEDNRWKAGADREYSFDLVSGASFTAAYELLKDRLDQRFVAAVSDKDVQPLWEVPVKHLKRFGGTNGILAFGRDRVVFTTDKPGESRTWRLSDIENVSTTGPFQLTITTYERARMQYGDMKSFNFQLKRALDQRRYDELWRRLNAPKGLASLNSNDTERKDTE